MGLFLFLIIIAILFGLGGLLTAAKWLLIIGLIFFLLGAFSYGGYGGGGGWFRGGRRW